MPDFIPGLKLNALFFEEVIAPLMAEAFPGLLYSAARLGPGSDVLGYDTPMSTDHDWGVRQTIFLTPADYAQYQVEIVALFRQRFPHTFRGYSVHFGPADAAGTQLLVEKGEGLVNHRVGVTTVAAFVQAYLAFDLEAAVTVFDWLTFTQQHLLGLTKGQVYVDQLGELERMRQKFAYYPHEVWLYLLLAQWARISQEEHFVGRTGYVGDELGSQLLAARLVHDMMQLCFLMEKQYAPYPKWFGTAFAGLRGAAQLGDIFRAVLAAPTWRLREKHLCAAYERVAAMHNDLQITEPLDTTVRPFHDRPFLVIDGGRFMDAIRHVITDETIQNIHTNIGSIDQFSHSTDLREYTHLHRRLQTLYQ